MRVSYSFLRFENERVYPTTLFIYAKQIPCFNLTIKNKIPGVPEYVLLELPSYEMKFLNINLKLVPDRRPCLDSWFNYISRFLKQVN